MAAPVTNPESRISVIASGKRLEYFTIGWHVLEGVISTAAGIAAGSLSLVGFGVDSLIELGSGSVMLWRMHRDHHAEHRARYEQIALYAIGCSFILLALYLLLEAMEDILHKQAPETSIPGIVIAALSLIVMPMLSRAKKRVAVHLSSRAMKADAKQADFCTYLSAILLTGLLLNSLFGWWWADPVAAVIMALIIGNEGVNTTLMDGDDCCGR
jgi:divalent metal cation (Fe/Co/Zn/Cd) transporter